MPRTTPASSLSVLFAALVSLVLAHGASAAVRYVDAAAPPGGNGLSWATAYNAIPPFLFPFAFGDEYRIAQGTYKPAGPGGSRAATFNFPCTGGVVNGGYAGFHAGGGTLDPDTRDPGLYPTILSGDLDGNDTSEFGNRADNSWHVVTISYGLGPIPTVDGFVITGGYADGGGTVDNNGGGVFGDPVTLRNCFIYDNHANFAGGGVYTGHAGGNIPFGGSRYENCRFYNNRSTGIGVSQGGGVFYIANPAASALTVYFINCEFAENLATFQGGGAIVERAYATFYNCLFRLNTTNTNDGAALALGSGQHKVINCTIANNGANAGVGYGAIGAAPLQVGQQRFVSIANTIIWANTPAAFGFALFPGLSATYSDIQGSPLLGVGNINQDPLFLSPTFDYDLTPGSPCIDAGSTQAALVQAALFTVSSDLARASRFFDDPATPDTGPGGGPVADMGCFEFAPAPPGDPCPTDTNADGVIDFVDLNAILSLYGEPCP